MKKYEVTFTVIYNGTLEVEAESKQDALNIAMDATDIGECEFPRNAKYGKVDFTFGEVTADYVEEIED